MFLCSYLNYLCFLDYLLFNFNKTFLCLLFYNLILIMNMEQMNFMSVT